LKLEINEIDFVIPLALLPDRYHVMHLLQLQLIVFFLLHTCTVQVRRIISSQEQEKLMQDSVGFYDSNNGTDYSKFGPADPLLLFENDSNTFYEVGSKYY